MPIIFVMKEPQVTLAVKGKVDAKFTEGLSKLFGFITLPAADDLPMIIPVLKETNIAYIKEITPEQYSKMEEEKKLAEAERKKRQALAGGRISDPRAEFPGRKFRRGN